MVLYIKLDQKQWGQKDASDQADTDFSGTIYTDEALSSTFDISAYTGDLRFISPNDDSLIFSTDTDLTLNADGTFTWRPSEGTSTSSKGYVKVRLRLTLANERLTCIGVNGSDDLFLMAD